MNTSFNLLTQNNNENTNVYVNNLHEINYLQRLKKINSRDNIYLKTNSSNLNTVRKNNYNTTTNTYNTKNNHINNRNTESSCIFIL
jgi:hypothetical protein